MSPLKDLINRVLTEVPYATNPYFVNLAGGEFKKEDFIETQAQFFSNVIFFSRPMAAVAGRIPSPEMRLEVLRNIWEEHGEGQLSVGHGTTFLTFLNRLAGLSEEDVLRRGLWAETRMFNTLLAGVSVLDDFLISVATMGMIERMFADISAWIGQGIIKRGWLTDETMIHYKLHQELDIKHSDDFFQILAEPFARSPENRYHIEQGLRLGATAFNQLYLGLWAARERRWLMDAWIPPSRSSDFIP
jgi:pyrroloquinoline quinone (PQQ) biosynthesis protein C